MNITYRRPYCASCRLILGKPSIGRVFNCNQCGQPLTLKSFNPWLKALAGLGIIIGGLLTMTIPRFPLFWIGGLLFGPVFIFNGVRQWLKIRNLDGDLGRSIPTERLKQERILTCKKCGSKNRVASHSRKLCPICGNCKTALSESLVVTMKRIGSRLKPMWIAACVVAVIVVLVVLGNRTPAHAPALAQSAPYRTGEPRPSRPQSDQILLDRRILPVNIGQAKEDWLPQLNRRLPNGTVIRSVNLDGSGKLEINNGLSYDAVVKLVNLQTDQCVAYFCISAGAIYTLPCIPDGNYRLLFAVGEDWDNTKGFFSRPKGMSEFSKKLLFETSQRYEGNYVYQECSVMEMTLHPVLQGNAKTHTVSLTEFEKY